MSNLFFFLKISLFILIIDGFHYGSPSSLRLLKGFPRRQKRACAMATTRKQSMPIYCPKGCERLQSAQILNQFELICSATNFHKTSRNTCILYCYTAFKSEFSQQVSKDMEMWGGSITTKQKPNYSFLRDSDQDIWNQLLTLFFYYVKVIHLNL